MDIRIRRENNATVFELSGNIDDAGACELENVFDNELQKGIDRLVFDLSYLENLSEAGLRTLFKAHKRTNGNAIIRNANSSIKEYFETTGFDSVFIFE